MKPVPPRENSSTTVVILQFYLGGTGKAACGMGRRTSASHVDVCFLSRPGVIVVVPRPVVARSSVHGDAEDALALSEEVEARVDETVAVVFARGFRLGQQLGILANVPAVVIEAGEVRRAGIYSNQGCCTQKRELLVSLFCNLAYGHAMIRWVPV